MKKMLSSQYYLKYKNQQKDCKDDKELFNPFKNIKNDENIINEEEDIGMCKLVLRKLIKDFTYERVFSTIPKKNKYMNSLLERPLDSLLKQYKINTINKAMKELEEEIRIENIK